MSCAAGVIPGVLTLIAARNGSFRIDLNLTDDAGPLDLTGYSARMQVRASPGAVPAYLDINSTSPSSNGSQLAFLTDATSGVTCILEVYISNADLIALPAGSPVASPVNLAYDIVLTEPGGDFAPYLQGAFLVTEGVTR